MEYQFTYAYLGTLTGAVTATVLVVEFIKEIKYFKSLPTRCLVYMVAETVVLLTSIAEGKFTVMNLPLYFLNGLLVMTSALGSWQIINDNMSGRIKRKA